VSSTVAIRELRHTELRLAAELTARGMRDNPLNIAAFGLDADRRLARMRRMFRIALPMTFRKGVIIGAFNGAALVGVAASVSSISCQASPIEKVALTPRILAAVGPSGFARLLRWTSAWAARDCMEPHWHLGPVAVDTHLQRSGFGSKLLADYCERLDRAGAAAYLETDKSENVRFYSKFGFRTVGEGAVLGIPNWFMRRDAAGART
jgi:hypothetical protein